MKAIVVTCPHCGARVQVKGSSQEVKCDYCETVARVQRRTQFLERTMPPPSVGPKLVAVQKHGKWFAIIMASTFLLPLVIVGFVFWQISRTTDQVMNVLPKMSGGMPVVPSVASKSPPRIEWQGNRPLLMDVDGDGKPEILGRARVLHPLDEIRIVALDGSSGKPRWQSPSLGTYNDAYQGVLSAGAGVVLFATSRGEVQAFEPRDGTPKWTAKLDEKVKHVCATAAGPIVAVGKDDVERPLDRTTGAALAGTAEKPAAAPVMRRPSSEPTCPVLASDGHRMRDHRAPDYRLAQRLGIMSSHHERTADGGQLLVGQRLTGTRTPMLALVDEKNAERWKVLVATDALAASEQRPEHVAVGDREVCAVYASKNGTFDKRLTCFVLADGTRRWEVEVPDDTDHVLLHNRAIVLVADDGLQLHDLDSGAQRWRWPQ